MLSIDAAPSSWSSPRASPVPIPSPLLEPPMNATRELEIKRTSIDERPNSTYPVPIDDRKPTPTSTRDLEIKRTAIEELPR
jgi:hypothetical protein